LIISSSKVFGKTDRTEGQAAGNVCRKRAFRYVLLFILCRIDVLHQQINILSINKCLRFKPQAPPIPMSIVVGV